MIDILLKTILFVPKFGIHSFQVGFLSSKIARALQLDPFEAFYCGVLHDIGVLTPHKGIVLDDIDNQFLISQDISTLESPTKDHTLISAFEISKISVLTERFKNISTAVLLHHAMPQYLNDTNQSNVYANIVSISEEISKYILVNDDELAYEDIIIPLSTMKNRYFDFVYDAAIHTLKEEYLRWMLYDIKAGYNREEIIEEFKIDVKPSMEKIVEIGAVLSYMIDSKSQFTREHSWRVAKISSAIAKEILLPEDEFFIAGLFHDIGKVTTPVAVLEKKGKLTQQEMDIMRKHVYYSYIILLNHKDEPWFFPAVRHQERVDGSGYPWKLKGNEMTFKDKILQVADYFVAVLEPRPYRGPNSPQKAYEEVARAVENGTLDIGPASILRDLVYGGYNFESIDFMSSIQKDIEDFEKSIGEV